MKYSLQYSMIFRMYNFSELLRNHTLKFLSRTLPILKDDDTLPKVTQVVENDFLESKKDFRRQSGKELNLRRKKRDNHADPDRSSRKFCDEGGVFCAVYRAIRGESNNSQLTAERREEVNSSQAQFQGRRYFL